MPVDNERLNDWFCREVLPCEPKLTGFIQRRWHVPEEVADIRQEIYERVLIGARRELPAQIAPYLFTIARNHLINRYRRAQVISFDKITYLENMEADGDLLTPERHVMGREELRHLQDGLNVLPPRCREVIFLRKVRGFSTREVAEQLGIGIDAVEQHTTLGMRALVDYLLGGSGKVQRRQSRNRRRQGQAS